MKRPKEAIERLRRWSVGAYPSPDGRAIITYLDSLPEWVGEWPADLTRERLDELCARDDPAGRAKVYGALRTLAAIAPVRKKRVVNLWECPHISPDPVGKPTDWAPLDHDNWKLVKRNVELED